MKRVISVLMIIVCVFFVSGCDIADNAPISSQETVNNEITVNINEAPFNEVDRIEFCFTPAQGPPREFISITENEDVEFVLSLMDGFKYTKLDMPPTIGFSPVEGFNDSKTVFVHSWDWQFLSIGKEHYKLIDGQEEKAKNTYKKFEEKAQEWRDSGKYEVFEK